MTKQELMEASDETLVFWMASLDAEMERRGRGAMVLSIHAGNVVGGKPIPLVIRVIRKVVSLKPGDLSKVETLVDGFTTVAP